MACILLCFDGSPVEGDRRGGNPNLFQISMLESCYVNQPACLCSVLLPCCAAYYTRQRVLDGDLSRYICCQGYLDNQCFQAGSVGERECPQFCLGLETVLCLGPSISATRLYVMDKYQLQSDPCDSQIIRFNNFIQILACICQIAEVFSKPLRKLHLARHIHMLGDIVFYSAFGCMASQVSREMDYRTSRGSGIGSADSGMIATATDAVIYQPIEVDVEPESVKKGGGRNNAGKRVFTV